MEDYILREIDRLGEMLLMIARRLGLLDGDTPDSFKYGRRPEGRTPKRCSCISGWEGLFLFQASLVQE